MVHFYAAVADFAREHGMWGVAMFMVIENLGLPFPTEAGFITAQALINAAAHPRGEYWVAFAFITCGHLLGAGCGYCAGRAGDNALARWFSHSKHITYARAKTQHWYSRYGAMTVLFGRLVGQVRPWSSFLAGVAGVPPATYWLWTVIGTVIYVPIAMWFTAWGWKFWMEYPQIRVPAIILMLLLFYGAAIGAVVHKLLQRRRNRQRREQDAASEDSAGGDEPED